MQQQRYNSMHYVCDKSVTSQGFLPSKFIVFLEIIVGVEFGKIDFKQAGNDDFECHHVPFSSIFTNATPVRVFASVSHGNESSQVHDSAFVWVEDVTTSRFKACVVTGGQGSGANTTVDWFAFQGPQAGVEHGETSFTLFTTGTKCNRVAFSRVRS